MWLALRKGGKTKMYLHEAFWSSQALKVRLNIRGLGSTEKKREAAKLALSCKGGKKKVKESSSEGKKANVLSRMNMSGGATCRGRHVVWEKGKSGLFREVRKLEDCPLIKTERVY